jgi:uncharacterized coiled-coil protein SlyX
MPVPWNQIVQLMPSIIDVSRELLRRSRTPLTHLPSLAATAELEARVAALEENEQRQAQLVASMVDQLAQLTTAVTVLHRQVRRLIIGQIATALIALIAVVLALRWVHLR